MSSQIVKNSDVSSYLNFSRPLYCSHLSYASNTPALSFPAHPCVSVYAFLINCAVLFCHLYVPIMLVQGTIPVIDWVQLEGKDHVTLVLSFFPFKVISEASSIITT